MWYNLAGFLPASLYRIEMKFSFVALSLLACFVLPQICVAAPAGYGDSALIFNDEFDSFSVSADGSGTTWNLIQYQNYEGSAWRKYQSKDDGLVVDNGDGTVTLWGKKGTYSNEKNSTATEVVYEDNTYGCGGIFTDKTFTFQYGYVEVKAKFDSVQGVWPAIWMMPVSNDGNDWPYNGEIDLMEHLNNDSKVYQTLHFFNDSGTADISGAGVQCGISGTNDWHAYGMEWQPDAISYYVDGVKTGTLYAADYINWPFARENNEFYLLIDQQIGGGWVEGEGTGGIDDKTLAGDGAAFSLDYAKVYSANGVTTANTWKNGTSATWSEGVELADGSTWSGSETMIFDATKEQVRVDSVYVTSIAARNESDVVLAGGTITNTDNQTIRLFADVNSSMTIESDLNYRAGLNIGGASGSSVVLSGNVSGSGNLNINSGEVTVAGSIATSGRTINVNAGHLIVTGNSTQSYDDAAGSITIKSGATLSIQSGGALFLRSSASGNTKGVVTVNGTLSLEYFGWGNTNSSLGCLGYSASNFVMTNGARLEITESGASGRAITMNGYGSTYTIAVADGKTFTWNKDTNANVLTQGSGAGCVLCLEVGSDAVMTMGKEINDGLALTKKGLGHLTYDGNISLVSQRAVNVKEGTMMVTGNVTNTDIKLYGGSLAVNGATTLSSSTSVEISSGASFTTGADEECITVTVAEGASQAILSASEANTAVSLASSALTFSNASVTLDRTSDFTVNATMNASSVRNVGSGSVTMAASTSGSCLINDSGTGTATGSITDSFVSSSQVDYKKIRAVTGDVLLYNKSVGVSITELEISGDSIVSVYSGSVANEADEVSAIVSDGVLRANGGRLNANLTICGSLVSISGENGLTLGSTLTIGENNTLDWSLVTVSLVNDGDSYVLFSGVDSLTIAGTKYSNYTGAITLEDNVLATDIFGGYTGKDSGAYVLTYTGGDDAVLSITYRAIPEPSMGFLIASSFALLAMRRRRKK